MSILEIQARLKAPKSHFNAFGKYNYRNCEDICTAAKPLLAEYGYHLILTDEVVEVGGRVYVKATAIVKEGEKVIESATAYAREAETKKGMDDSQITGTASSYSRKYALNGLFAIDDTKDADSMNNSASGETSEMLEDAKTALEKGDWSKLCELDRQEGWLDVWGKLDGRKKKAIKELMHKANEYRDLIHDYDDKQDDDGILQLWEELNKEGKTEIWRRLNDTAKARITQLRKAA